MKQKNYIVGLYLRLSKDDERQGESLLSIIKELFSVSMRKNTILLSMTNT